MTLARYAKNKGMTLEQFINLKENIEATAQAILTGIKKDYPVDSGMYYPTSEIITDGELKPYIINELKRLSVEFYDNCELFRF